MTPADRIRAAAGRLREVAGGATPGPWFDSRGGDDFCDGPLVVSDNASVVSEWHASEADAAYIATMSPPVALAMADVLDAVVVFINGGGIGSTEDRGVINSAVSFADAVLGVREVTA